VLILTVVAALAALMFGLRTYRSFVLLRSAYAVGAPDVSSVRPWMTLGYVAGAYRVSEAALAQRLGRPPDIDPATTLMSLARAQGRSPFRHVQEVQEAISELRRLSPVSSERLASSPDSLGSEFLGGLLVYGYPVLGAMLFLGALGLHLPSALAMVVAGSLAAQGRMSWLGASAVGVSGSVVGDVAGYSLGRVLGQEFLERRGRWIGLTPERRTRVERLFERWGALTVVLSRSLLSFLGPAVNVLAGAGRYSLRRFLPLDVVGRLVWTSGYLGLGYSLGVGIEAAADFLSSLSGLLVSLAALAGLGLLVYRDRGWLAHPGGPAGLAAMVLVLGSMVRILNLPGPGVLVQRVVPDSTGARLGLRGGFVKATIGERTIILGGDVILKAQGVPIGDAPRRRGQRRRVGPGDTLSVTGTVHGAPATVNSRTSGTGE
jgi:membrane protein DedA with SNARE-associated domain